MTCRPAFAVLLTAVIAIVSRGAIADVKLPVIFADHMVLQRGVKVPIWGQADPGEKVTVTAGTQSASAVADERGAWRATLEPITAGDAFQLVVAGKNSITINDVVVGEVWICSGQSNMAFKLSQASTSREAIAAAARPRLRYFGIPQDYAESPRDDLKGGKWVVSSPAVAKSFSAVAYHFGIELQDKLDVPIGLIDASWGGTRAEAWTPAETFSRLSLPYEPEWTQTYLNPKRVASSTRPAEPRPFQAPSALYNAMIHPLGGYAMRGVIWYQGESNSGSRAPHYDKVLGALIEGWRNRWGQGDFPFLIVQLANFDVTRGRPAQIVGGGWPELRAAQARVVRKLPNVGLAVTIDVGDAKTIHPANKAEVGRRLALLAEKMAYGREVVSAGPAFKAVRIDGSRAIVEFEDGGSPLVNKGEHVTGFELAGADGKFVPAEAALDGNTVVLTAKDVASPASVRYGWDDDPACSLFNQASLPAAPFQAP